MTLSAAAVQGLGIAAMLSLAMAGAWAIALRTGKSGYVDAIWSYATATACVVACLAAAAVRERAFCIALLAALWGFRLGTHLLRRARAGDDPRYAALKREWGDRVPQKLFRFLQVQALASWPLVLAVWLAAGADRAFPDWQDAAGLGVAIAAMLGEALADAQLKRFKADPANRGRLCDRGLWSWSRHPNYFCEWLVWLGLALVAGPGWGWLALPAPVTMYLLLVHASGIPPLEQHLAQSRPEEFARYRARVSAFWPWPPRRLR